MVKWSERHPGSSWITGKNQGRITLDDDPKPLKSSHCYEALRSTFNKARAIEEEISKRKVSLFTRIWYSPQSRSSDFGVLLLSTHDRIPPVLEIEIPQLGDERLENLLEDYLNTDYDFHQSCSTYLVVFKDYEDSNAP